MSELEAATGEKKGGGDVSGVRDIFCFLGSCTIVSGVRDISCFFRQNSLAIVQLYNCERGELSIIVFCVYFIGNCAKSLE